MNKNKIIFLIIFAIFFVLSLSTYYNVSKQQEYIELKHHQSFDMLQQLIDGKIIFFRKQFGGRIRNIVRHNQVFKKAILSNDREVIAKTMNGLFKTLKKENRYTKTLQYISKNNISIYRAHKPDKFGDDLTNYRPIIKYVNQHKRAKYGFEAGLYAIVYRVDIPIFYNNKYYGILEYGIDADIFVNDLTSVSNYMKSDILVNKDIYLLMLKAKHSKNSHLKTIFGKYISLENQTFFTNIPFKNKIISSNYKFEYHHQRYVTFVYNLKSFNGNNNGKILIAINITADNHRLHNIIKLSIVIQLILIVIISLIVIYAFNYFEKVINQLREHEKENEKILYQQSKMASMGEMIGNIAHQWRQPLSVISTIASGIMVQKEYGMFKEDHLVDDMDKIVKQTAHMSKTIEDFRDFFKSDKEKILFNVKDTIRQNIDLIEASFKNHNITIDPKINQDIELFGYQNELTQALINILNNAKDQLIKLDKEELKLVSIETIIQNNMVEINITDNGGGVPKDIIDKVFDPYFTTKHQSQGTGIGLYMTHEIIVKHFNGQLYVTNVDFTYENKTYTGARFTIALPMIKE